MSYTNEMTTHGKANLKTALVDLILSTFLQVVAFYVCANSIAWPTVDMAKNTLMGYLALLAYNIVQIIYLFGINVGGKLNNHKLLSVINTITVIESKLLNINIEVDYKTLKIICKYLLASNILSTVYVIVFEEYIYLKSDFSEKFVLGYAVLAEQQLLLKYMTILLILRHIIRCINSHIYKLYINGSTRLEYDLGYKRQTFKVMSIVYGELFELCANFNSLISLNMLFLFASFFSYMVFEIFICSAKIGASTEAEFEISASVTINTIVYSLLILLCYVITAELYYKEVVKFKQNLRNLMIHSNDEQLREEVNALTLQLSHENYEITAAGFFVIDLKLVFSIMAAISTYTIILVQYDPKAKMFHHFIDESDL